MMRDLSTPIYHHIVPRFYLEAFANNGMLWAFRQAKAPYQAAPKKMARERRFYSPDANVNDKNAIEAFLSDIESMAAPIHRKLTNGCEPLTEDRGVARRRPHDLTKTILRTDARKDAHGYLC